MLWPQRGKTQRFTTWPSSVLYHNKLLNNVFILFYFYVKAVPPHMHITMHTKKYLDAIIHLWLVTGRVKTWCGGPTMSLCPKSTAGVAAQCALWVGALTSPCGFKLKDYILPPPDTQEVKARSNRGEVSQFSLGQEHTWQCNDTLWEAGHKVWVFISSGSSMSVGNIGHILTFTWLVAAGCLDNELH